MSNVTPRTVEILSQVAFKGAVELAAAGKFEVTDIRQLTADFTGDMLAVINEEVGKLPEPTPQRAAAPSGGMTNQEAEDAFAGEGLTEGVKVLGTQHGPLPTWLVTAAAAKGVTKVFDNREDAKGTKRPWFKTPKDADKYGEPADEPFWPPRN